MKLPTNHRMAERMFLRGVRDGLFEIDTEGRIWRLARRQGKKEGGVKIVPVTRRRAENSSGDYLQVRVMYQGERIHASAHRVIWQHFNGPIPYGLTINHKDGVKVHNWPDNLELATYSEQMKHAYRLGLRDEHGEGNPAVKLRNEDISTIRYLHFSGTLQITIAAIFEVSFQHVSEIVRGETRRKQTGIVDRSDHRFMPGRDLQTGRFLGKTSDPQGVTQ